MKVLNLIGSLFFVALVIAATSCFPQKNESKDSIGYTELSEFQGNYRVEIDRKNLAPWQDSILVEALNKITQSKVPLVPDSIRIKPSSVIGTKLDTINTPNNYFIGEKKLVTVYKEFQNGNTAFYTADSNQLKPGEVPIRGIYRGNTQHEGASFTLSDDCCNTAIGHYASRNVKGMHQHDNPPSRIIMKCKCGQVLDCTGNCDEVICVKCSRKYYTK